MCTFAQTRFEETKAVSSSKCRKLYSSLLGKAGEVPIVRRLKPMPGQPTLRSSSKAQLNGPAVNELQYRMSASVPVKWIARRHALGVGAAQFAPGL